MYCVCVCVPYNMAKAKRVMYMPVLMFMHILDEFYVIRLGTTYYTVCRSGKRITVYGEHENIFGMVWIT